MRFKSMRKGVDQRVHAKRMPLIFEMSVAAFCESDSPVALRPGQSREGLVCQQALG